jgi:hypothetical protein
MFTGRWTDNVLYPGGAIDEHEEPLLAIEIKKSLVNGFS